MPGSNAFGWAYFGQGYVGSRAFSLSLSDSTSLSDSIGKQAGSSLADSVTVTDAVQVGDVLHIADAVAVDDEITLTLTPSFELPIPQGGWKPLVIRRHHKWDLADIVLVSDEYELDLAPDPDLQREEELILALA